MPTEEQYKKAHEAEEAEVDTGPLTKTQLQGLAKDGVLHLREIAKELVKHGVRYDVWLLDRIEFQLCGDE